MLSKRKESLNSNFLDVLENTSRDRDRRSRDLEVLKFQLLQATRPIILPPSLCLFATVASHVGLTSSAQE